MIIYILIVFKPLPSPAVTPAVWKNALFLSFHQNTSISFFIS